MHQCWTNEAEAATEANRSVLCAATALRDVTVDGELGIEVLGTEAHLKLAHCRRSVILRSQTDHSVGMAVRTDRKSDRVDTNTDIGE